MKNFLTIQRTEILWQREVRATHPTRFHTRSSPENYRTLRFAARGPAAERKCFFFFPVAALKRRSSTFSSCLKHEESMFTSCCPMSLDASPADGGRAAIYRRVRTNRGINPCCRRPGPKRMRRGDGLLERGTRETLSLAKGEPQAECTKM